MRSPAEARASAARMEVPGCTTKVRAEAGMVQRAAAAARTRRMGFPSVRDSAYRFGAICSIRLAQRARRKPGRGGESADPADLLHLEKEGRKTGQPHRFAAGMACREGGLAGFRIGQLRAAANERGARGLRGRRRRVDDEEAR